MARLRRVLVLGVLCGAVFAVDLLSLCAQEKPAKAIPIADPSPLLVEPKTPEEFFATTLLMVDLARIDLARKYLEEFEAAADDDLLLKMRDKHGTAEFVKLSRIADLQPLSTQLLDRLSALARKQSEDPAFVDGLIARLSEGPTQRELAIRELRNAGARAVPQILKQMSLPEMVTKQDSLVVALTRMGRQVVPPVLAGLDSPQERIRAAMIEVLGFLDANEAIPHLWYPAFDEDQPKGVRNAAQRTLAKLVTGSSERTDRLSSVTASLELRRLSRMLFQKSDLLPLETDGTVAIWVWDDAQGTVAYKSYAPPVAAMLLSSRFARQSLALSPDQPEPQRQYLAALLGLEVLQNGWEKPRTADPGTSMYLALTAGEETVSLVLADALEAGQPSTAVAALEVLGRIGTREQLLGLKGLKSPVLAALNSPDTRVQFAAANTVLRMEPKASFPGANRVVSILSRALTDPGASRAIVIDADAARGSTTSSYLVDVGYEGVVAATGREGFEIAVNHAGTDVIVVHVNCLRWELTQTLANLRADSRTAAVPVVVYGPESTRSQVARLVARSSPAVYVSESAAAEDFIRQYRPFITGLKSSALSAQERQRQKSAAAFWLATLATNQGPRVFDVSAAEKELALVAESADVGANAIIALGGISSGSAQRRLSSVALNPQVDPALREAAASQLGYHIQKFGLLLTKDEVAQVHEGWVAAKEPTVKSALAGVVGTLRPNATLVGERLQRFPTPVGQTP